MNDLVNNPKHYTSHQSGIECIEITRHLPFNRGNAIKYLWRCGKKDDSNQELKKAIWYLKDELKHCNYKKVPKIVCMLLEQVAFYNDENTRLLFNYIVFGQKTHLKKAIKMIEEMCDDNI